MYGQQQQIPLQNNFGQVPQTFGQPQQQPMVMNNSQPTNFYQPQQPMQPGNSQSINYNNFQTFAGQQQQVQPQQTMSPPPQAVVEPPKQKLPLPEEFIYLQTVFEELKSQCSNAAKNPVS